MSNSVIENKFVAYLDNEDSANISNPIHSTEVANSYGFSGPLVGGVTVWGWCTDTILQALGEDWLGHGWSEYSFRQPVYPGDVLTIRAEQVRSNGDIEWEISMINQSEVVCVSGKVGLNNAPWLSELVRPNSMKVVDDVENKGLMALESVEINKDWNAQKITFSSEVNKDFLSTKQLTDNPVFCGDFAVAHPSWIAGWPEQLLRHNFIIPSSMHTRSKVQFYKKVPIGTSVIGGAILLDAYERKAHHFANFDVLIQDQYGEDVAIMRHWTIFRIATPEERVN
tara:strand:+ start:4565 stop:5410 length:846 start_codon:yes stop_codon:yes gene_type:complete